MGSTPGGYKFTARLMDKSHSILDDAVLISKRGLIRAKEKKYDGKDDRVRFTDELVSDYDGMTSSYSDGSIYNNITKQKMDQLYTKFLDVLQVRTNDLEIFDTLLDLIQVCNDTIEDLSDGSRKTAEKICEENWLQNERNTWKLLYCLYKDRLFNQKDDMDVDDLGLAISEKQVVEQLYLNNSVLREYQLVVDWLELCLVEQGTYKIGHYTDRTVAWENTLHHLENCGETMFGSGKEIVKSMDPDAPLREGRPLHDLDSSDEVKLSRQIFFALRQGKFEEAQSLCEHCGQTWRAALLEGWRLHHDPNYFENTNPTLKMPIEGNPRRDIWKKFAYLMADNKKLEEFTRAIAGVFSGHLDSLLNVSRNWHDMLWSYLKVQIDIRVEMEIRSTCMKKYLDMPENHARNQMTLEHIFSELTGSKTISIQNMAKDPINVIQKCLILDNLTELLRNANNWLEDGILTPQMLRFLTHIILFIRQIGRPHQDDIADRIIRAYVESLIKFHHPQLIAFYTASLPPEMQKILYSKFLLTITDSGLKKKCLEDAISCGLDYDEITTYTVEMVKNTMNESEDFIERQDTISEFDLNIIQALEWLTFYPEQRCGLVWQTNAFIRNYLAQRKLLCVKKCFDFVPNDSIQVIIKHFGTKDDIPYKHECSIKEFLSFQAYLAAIDGYNDWSYLYHSKPKPPELPKVGANFTERVAMEHKENSYRIELENWEQSMKTQTSVTKDLLYNILLFPENGWLHDPEAMQDFSNADEIKIWEHRVIQMSNLRKMYIPEIVLLLHNVFHLSGSYKECLRLADVIVCENRKIYKCYSKHKLGEILTKMAESSLALMNERCDPWGYSTT